MLLAAFLAAASVVVALPKNKCHVPHPSSTTTSITTSAVVPSPTSYPKTITLLHTNDIHAHMEEFNYGGTACNAKAIASNSCFGGVARIKTVVDAYRANTSNVILMDAGDQFQGTLFFNFYGGIVSSLYMNLLKYDVMTIGNHEFDKGPQFLADYVKTLNFPVVSSNINLGDTSSDFIKPLREAGIAPYTILKEYNMAVIGFITNTTASIISNGTQITKDILDPVATVQKYVDELNAKGIKRIICLSHNGYQDDVYLAQNVRGVGLIVGGHSHSLLLKNLSAQAVVGPYPTVAVSSKSGANTWIVQAHRFGDYLGHIVLEWSDEDVLTSVTGDPILLDQSIAKDASLNATIVGYEAKFATLANDVLTSTSTAFPACSGNGECAMGSLIADCIISEQKGKGDQAQVAFLNSGGIRADFQVGNISAADVLTVLPFGNAVVNFVWSGARLMQQLERVAAGGDFDGVGTKKIVTYPQWGGVAFTYNTSLPLGSRVVKATVGGAALDTAANYNVAGIDFVLTGGDNIVSPAFTTLPPVGDVLADLLTSCLRKKGAGIAPETAPFQFGATILQ